MSKKVFTILLLAVFMLAQFSVASAAAIAGDTVLDTLPVFNNATDIKLAWSVTGMDGDPVQNVLIWSRVKAVAPGNVWGDCQGDINVGGLTEANSSFTYLIPGAVLDQDVLEFKVVVDDLTCAGGALPPALGSAANGSTFIDDEWLDGFLANPPSLDVIGAFDSHRVSCNTFEMWALFSDQYDNGAEWATDGYSGLDSWNETVTGTFAPPAPIGPANQLLEWQYTFPATASDGWTFSIDPTDAAGNAWGVDEFRDGLLLTSVTSGEKADCVDFSDTAGNANELYVRYLADLGIGAGNPDGTYGPDTTLTRAEASALFEIANGYTEGTLPPAAPSAACTFTDVTASDWFAGWVWQACDDGFLNGLGGGLFGPADLLTRGQIVTIFNNIDINGGGVADSYFDYATIDTVLETEWNQWAGGGFPELREGAWSDVSIGAFYAFPVVYAYGVGVAEGTSATTFSPDQAILRGEFAKMLYRAISRTN